jgi:hypothetical protein
MAGPLLAGERVDGELLRTPPVEHSAPDSPVARFPGIVSERIGSTLDAQFDLHPRVFSRLREVALSACSDASLSRR